MHVTLTCIVRSFEHSHSRSIYSSIQDKSETRRTRKASRATCHAFNIQHGTAHDDDTTETRVQLKPVSETAHIITDDDDDDDDGGHLSTYRWTETCT